MLITGYWIEVSDGDSRAVGLFERHYSNTNKDTDHVRYGFSGEGESMILLTSDCRALFGWRKQKITDDGQLGVNCFIFRNESDLLSSQLILEAEKFAWHRWAGERLYTYVNGKKIKSTNPGYCFLKAGWKRCGRTKKGLIILEKLF